MMSEVSDRHAARPRILDLVAMTVGYGLAGMLFQAFWPHAGVSPAQGAFAIGFYVWLGAAMSGPLVLLGRGGPSPAPPPRPGTRMARRLPTATEPTPAADRPAARTWAETTWLVIGIYWMILGGVVLPSRLQRFQASDGVLFGLVPLAVGVLMGLFSPRKGSNAGGPTGWTHRLAVSLLVTWPAAWICLIVAASSAL